MIITTLVLLAVFTLILIGLGFYTDIQDYKTLFLLSGFLFLFLLSLNFYNDGVDYKSGETQVLVGNQTTINYNYTNYKSPTIGLFSIFLGGLGFGLVMFHLKSWREEQDE